MEEIFYSDNNRAMHETRTACQARRARHAMSKSCDARRAVTVLGALCALTLRRMFILTSETYFRK